GIYLAVKKFTGGDVKTLLSFIKQVSKKVVQARPTAVNLAWAVKQMTEKISEKTVKAIKREILMKFDDLLNEETLNNIDLGVNGANLITDGDQILTHCNAGSLSGIWLGTATAPIYVAQEEGKKFMVHIDETRPWLQGSRLTAWEFNQAGVDHQINVDNAAATLMKQGMVNKVIVGADRIAANGDTANKIGTYQLAILAKEHNIPFYVAAVTATIDFATASGDLIPIEERSADEVTKFIKFLNKPVAPKNSKVFNPVFDITPVEYITAFITEKGVFKPSEISAIENL
ncbi:MAG: S-methyl-5-thioribose-1-phosphate isomerase, partial [bacterium]